MTASTAVLAPNWEDRALCGNHDPAWWDLHPGNNLTADNHQALAICRRCPVAVQCAAYLRPDDVGFIRAGFPVRERDEAKTLAAAGRARLGLKPAAEPTAPARPAAVVVRADCTDPGYGSYMRHIRGGQQTCGACRAWVRERDRAYRERRQEAAS